MSRYAEWFEIWISFSKYWTKRHAERAPINEYDELAYFALLALAED